MYDSSANKKHWIWICPTCKSENSHSAITCSKCINTEEYLKEKNARLELLLEDPNGHGK
jgi:ribosomal protein L40E